MGLLRNRPSGPPRLSATAFGMAAALALACGAGPADAAQVLACKLSIDDGQRLSPPGDMTISVAPDELLKWTDTGWSRNQCGNHGGAAPDVACSIHDGHFQADFAWESNVGRLEHHVVLNLTTGELTVHDHNGLKQKGVCRPAPEPVLPPPPAVATTPSAAAKPAAGPPAPGPSTPPNPVPHL